jgi:hypothetical protein
MMADALEDALVREEHAQGMPYGDQPDHCGRCRLTWLVTNCTHSVWVDATKLGDPFQVRICAGCGRQEQVPW